MIYEPEQPFGKYREQCANCGRIVNVEGDCYYDRADRSDPESDVLPFCDKGCAEAYHEKRQRSEGEAEYAVNLQDLQYLRTPESKVPPFVLNGLLRDVSDPQDIFQVNPRLPGTYALRLRCEPERAKATLAVLLKLWKGDRQHTTQRGKAGHPLRMYRKKPADCGWHELHRLYGSADVDARP